MATEQIAHRSVAIRRVAGSQFAITNDRGGEMTVGAGAGTEFTPVDLLLAAIGVCSAIDVDILTSRRAEPDTFTMRVEAEKIRDEGGNHLTDIVATLAVTFPRPPPEMRPGRSCRTWCASRTTGCAPSAGLSNSARRSPPGSASRIS